MTVIILQILGNAFGFLIAVVFVILAGRSLLCDLWKFAFLSELPDRQKHAQMITAIVGLPIFSVSALFLGGENLTACIFVAIAVVPSVVWYVLNWWSWCHDPRDMRKAALEMAVERLSRANLKLPTLDQKIPWSDYLFDVEASKRRDAYDPPPI